MYQTPWKTPSVVVPGVISISLPDCRVFSTIVLFSVIMSMFCGSLLLGVVMIIYSKLSSACMHLILNSAPDSYAVPQNSHHSSPHVSHFHLGFMGSFGINKPGLDSPHSMWLWHVQPLRPSWFGSIVHFKGCLHFMQLCEGGALCVVEMSLSPGVGIGASP